MVKGKVIQFRRGRHTMHERHFLLDFGMKTRAEAQKLVGKDVEWISPGKEKKSIKGKISSAHGNKGIVRAIFERGLPGQSIGTEVDAK
jgi:large subunit ribosomal protein L35Ae